MSFLTNPSASINQIISKAVDLLRGKIDVRDYHAFSFLLFLHSKGIIKNISKLQPQNIRGYIYENVLMPEYKQKDKVVPLFKVFQKAIDKIEDLALYDLLHLIEYADRDSLSHNLGEMIEAMIYQVAKSEGRFGGEYVQPLELTKFICAIAEVQDGASVYNPFAGVASFGMYLNKDARYFGQELDIQSWAIGMLRLLANNRASNFELEVGNSVKDWNPRSENYDFILANPPFGLMDGFNDPKRKSPLSIDAFVVRQALESLKWGGTAILVLSSSFLYSNRKELVELRKILIQSGFIKSIISFPGGLLTNTSIPFSVLVLNKTSRRREVLIVDAANSISEISKRDKRIDFNRLITVMSTPELPYSKVVSVNDIIENDFNFNLSRYLIEDASVPFGEELGKLLRRSPRSKESVSFMGSIRTGLENNGYGRFVRVRDLKDNKQDFTLNAEVVEYEELPRATFKLDTSALLLTTRWKSLKPTYFEYKDKPVYLSPDVVAFEINERYVDIAYLVNELHADYVIAQLDRFRTGGIIPFIPVRDLLKVKVSLPPLKEQRAKVTGNVLKTLDEERSFIKKQAYEELASIKHSMGKPLLNLNAGVRNIEAVLSKLDKEWVNIRMSSKTDYTLGDAVKSLFANLNLLSNLLKNNEQELDVRAYPLNQVDALQFFRCYINDLKATDGNNYKINLDVSPDLEAEFEGNVFIKANEDLLKISMNNIIDNAQRHGFTKTGKEYKIEVRLGLQLEKDAAFIKIEVANNGEPFPKNFTLEKLVRKASIAGVTGNSGIGGYDINEIVKRHGGKLDIITDPEVADPFTTVYEILIPINASNGNNG